MKICVGRVVNFILSIYGDNYESVSALVDLHNKPCSCTLLPRSQTHFFTSKSAINFGQIEILETFYLVFSESNFYCCKWIYSYNFNQLRIIFRSACKYNSVRLTNFRFMHEEPLGKFLNVTYHAYLSKFSILNIWISVVYCRHIYIVAIFLGYLSESINLSENILVIVINNDI